MLRCLSFSFILPMFLLGVSLNFSAHAELLSLEQQNENNEIKRIVTLSAQGKSTPLTQETVRVRSIVELFYQERGYAAAWPPTHQISEVILAIKQSDSEGLYKEDYHYESLVKLHELYEKTTEVEAKNKALAELDVLLTDAVMHYAFHLINGKVDPSALNTAWNYSKKALLPQSVVDHLTQALKKGDIASGLNKFKPQFTLYKKLKQGLKQYQKLASTQKFITLPEKILRTGFTDPAVILLRERLMQEGFNVESSPTPALFDQALKQQVIAFQEQHGLEADGILGLQSVAAFNVTFAQRADQIRINLERTRWVHNHLKDDFILVNIAGYQLYLVNNNELVWKTEVMVGKQKNATETFRSSMFFINFNPTWTVPRSIMRQGLIDKVVADPSYLARHDFVLLDRKGEEVDTQTVNWKGLGVDNFPYSIRQLPGPHNALGKVKFTFANKYAIYLHDTPAKALFDKTQRAFSSGCVRVKNPLKLAELLLDDPNNWSEDKIQDVIDSQKLTKVELPTKREVMLMYWTAEPYEGGGIKFNPDIYNRDPALVKAFTQKKSSAI